VAAVQARDIDCGLRRRCGPAGAGAAGAAGASSAVSGAPPLLSRYFISAASAALRTNSTFLQLSRFSGHGHYIKRQSSANSLSLTSGGGDGVDVAIRAPCPALR